MMRSQMRRPAMLGLSLGATLLVAVIGCGGTGTETSDAVVQPSMSAIKTTAAPTAGTSAPAPTPASTTSTATAPVKAEGYGTLKGQVTYDGEAPAVKVLFEKGKAAKDPDVCAKDAPLVSERLLVDSGIKGVKNVLVFLSKPTSVSAEAKKAAATTSVVFDQSKCVFEPHVLAVMVNTPITLKSSDPVNHNINAKLKAAAFNKLLAAKAEEKYTPIGAERLPAEVTCDIHPWMRAWWMVLDHPYFAVTDEKGYFEIKNAPAGTQKVVVWQEALDKSGFITSPAGEEVVLKANDTVVKDFKVEPSRLLAQ
jgi:plastocyanin